MDIRCAFDSAEGVGARLPAICREPAANPVHAVYQVQPSRLVSLPLRGRSRASALLRPPARIKSRPVIRNACFVRSAWEDQNPFAFDLPASPVQTPPNATWVQAKRRRHGVGRAAWMPREPPPAMDGGWRRAHGASSECGNPTKSDPTRSRALLVTFGAFSKVTRCKSGTLSRRYRRNGYTPNPNPNPNPNPQ
ncbi:hypothetical protein SAMN05216605_106265 [Pseudomonas abietaniphila]|uniref:Uncharacterized protein n=1 Tax=Pseudomonas abietaniphila TaxID=89065 RepID=A0A1G8CJA5_9PSED|nr:hypothetical protein SAMN05216605_106265 [Pseudomonas abietaniphila]